MKVKKYTKFYCEHCGHKLILKERRLSYFDWSVGKSIYEREYRCPKENLFDRLFGIFFSRSHSKFLVIEGEGLDGKYRETILAERTY